MFENGAEITGLKYFTVWATKTDFRYQVAKAFSMRDFE